MLTQADKGRTIVIITQNAYIGKVHTFLLTISPPCPKIQPQNTTNFYKKPLQECNLIIDKQNIKYLLQKKPTPPTLKARIKLHKQDKPIRPVVNNTKSPIYKLAKYLINILNTNLNLSNTYTVTNSTHLALELYQLPVNENYRLITYDIKRPICQCAY